MNGNISEQKLLQEKYSNEVFKTYLKKGWKKPYPDSLIGDFIHCYPLKKALSMLPFTLKGVTALSICCGSGFEGEYLYKLGAEVVVSDISIEAVRAAKRRCHHLKGVVADSEHLPFKNRSFDLVLVRDGLHHLPNPSKGINEMFRISRKGYIFIEAQKSFFTNVFTKLKLAEEYEKSGNFVYRFTRREVKNLMKKQKINNYKIFTSWCHNIRFLSKYIYPHFNNKVSLVIFTFLFYMFNFLFGHYGNSMVVVALKD
ncbi:MAG: class I SAM-dependent methyltransferase [Candidatus Asgardarchaeia archaeon]